MQNYWGTHDQEGVGGRGSPKPTVTQAFGHGGNECMMNGIKDTVGCLQTSISSSSFNRTPILLRYTPSQPGEINSIL